MSVKSSVTSPLGSRFIVKTECLAAGGCASGSTSRLLHSSSRAVGGGPENRGGDDAKARDPDRGRPGGDGRRGDSRGDQQRRLAHPERDGDQYEEALPRRTHVYVGERPNRR